MDTVESVLGLCTSIYQMVENMKANKERCQRVAQRVKALEELALTIKQRGPDQISATVEKALKDLCIALISARQMILKFSQAKAIKSFLKSKSHEEEFCKVNQILTDNLQVLSGALQIEHGNMLYKVFRSMSTQEEDQNLTSPTASAPPPVATALSPPCVAIAPVPLIPLTSSPPSSTPLPVAPASLTMPTSNPTASAPPIMATASAPPPVATPSAPPSVDTALTLSTSSPTSPTLPPMATPSVGFTLPVSDHIAPVHPPTPRAPTPLSMPVYHPQALAPFPRPAAPNYFSMPVYHSPAPVHYFMSPRPVSTMPAHCVMSPVQMSPTGNMAQMPLSNVVYQHVPAPVSSVVTSPTRAQLDAAQKSSSVTSRVKKMFR